MNFHNKQHLTDQSKLVASIMEESGGITHLKAQHYGIGCVRKAISRLRSAVPVGHDIVRVVKKDKMGNKYSNWSFKKREGMSLTSYRGVSHAPAFA